MRIADYLLYQSARGRHTQARLTEFILPRIASLIGAHGIKTGKRMYATGENGRSPRGERKEKRRLLFLEALHRRRDEEALA